MTKKFSIAKDTTYGFWRLDPMPDSEDLAQFYREKYEVLLQKGGRAPDLRRQVDENSELELIWVERTLYADILANIGAAGKLLDVGCARGNLLSFMRENGWNITGIELSTDMAAVANERGLRVFNSSLDDFSRQCRDRFDAVTLLNVLEHIPQPDRVLVKIKEFLTDEGRICIRVPNDFSVLQEIAEKKLRCAKWWVAIPDHVNYFNSESLKRLVQSVGFEVTYLTADFPMELFLLMGDDYVGNPELGSLCHIKRRNLEMALPNDLRRALYESLAKLGLGRNLLMFAKLKR